MKLSEIRGNIEPGVFYSGVGHAGLVLWVLVGDWLFAPRASQEIMATQVSLMSEAEFSAMMSTSPAVSETPSEAPPGAQSPETPAETAPAPEVDRSPTPPARPDTSTPPAPDPVPDTPPPPVELPPDPVPDPIPGDVQPDPVVLAPVDQPLPSMSTSTRPRPKPANVVAPNPQSVPEDVQVADTSEAAVSEQPSETPQLPQETQEETVERETGDVLRTEATEDQDEALGMTSSTRPRARPAQRPTQTATTPTTPAANTNSNANAQNDAIANALNEASETPATPSNQGQGGGTRTPAPQGPPLTAGETGDVSAAIGRKWNLGAVSSEVMQTTVVVRVEFDPTGKPTDIRLIDSNGPSPDAARVAFDTARRAIQRTYLEGGIPLPPNKYATWKVVDFVFDANGMRFR